MHEIRGSELADKNREVTNEKVSRKWEILPDTACRLPPASSGVPQEWM